MYQVDKCTSWGTLILEKNVKIMLQLIISLLKYSISSMSSPGFGSKRCNYQCWCIRSWPARSMFCGGGVCSRGHGNLILDSNLLDAVRNYAPVAAN